MVMATVELLVHNVLSGQVTRIVAGAIVLAMSVGCTAEDISSQDISSQGERGQGGTTTCLEGRVN